MPKLSNSLPKYRKHKASGQALVTLSGRDRYLGPHGTKASKLQPVADSIVEATLPHLPAVLADMVQLQRLTAARPAEICILRPCDLDRSGEVWLYRPASHKTAYRGKQRIIQVGPRGQAILLKYLARDGEAYCFRPCDSEAKRLADLHAGRKTPLSCGNRPGSRAAERGRRKRKKQPGECYSTDSYRQLLQFTRTRELPATWSVRRQKPEVQG